MKQTIYKNGQFLTLDKKIPTMKALLVTDGTITASAEEFILQDIAPDAEVIDMKGGLMIPGFTETYSSILEQARALMAHTPELTDLNAALSQLCTTYAAYGITTVSNARTNKADLEALKAADTAGALTLDVAVYLTADASELLPTQMAVHTPYEGHLRLAGLSVLVDELMASETLTALFERSIQNHWQTAVEANSETAIEKVITSYYQALIHVNGSKTDEDGTVKPKIYEDLRPLLCGAAHLSDSQLTRLQALGFTPCFTHDNILVNGDQYADTLPTELAENIYPLRSIVRRGMAFSLQHDAVGMEPNMLASLYTACNRITASGHALGTEQTINADQAVNALTLFAGYQLCEDLHKGSLTPGKRADFVILNKNPLELSDANLKDLQVLMTVKDDVVRYKR
jgi:hypothetical protein